MATQLTLFHYLVQDMPNYKYGIPDCFTIEQHYNSLLLKHSKGGFFSICNKYFHSYLEKFSANSVDYDRLFIKTRTLAKALDDKFKAPKEIKENKA